MLVARFQETFRERMPEWVQAAGMLGWGLMALVSVGLFQAREFYHPLLLWLSQPMWGALALGIGFSRIAFLVINGAWRPSAHIRAIGCAMGAMLWSALLIAALNLDWVSTAVAVYGMLMVSDIFSLWFAAGDAKLADLSAKSRLKIT